MKKADKSANNSTKAPKADPAPTGPRPMAGSLKDVAAELSRFAGPKVKVKPEKLSELERLAVQETKKRFGKEDYAGHPEHIKNIMARHGGVIPQDHADRETMSSYITKLNTTPQRLEGRRLYQQYITGGNEYTRGIPLKKTEVEPKVKKNEINYTV